ncbi:hypothetical protein GOBAR_DD12871 [Gossypium barbadense]|nr:hypothetical protein GOBAR_DD12871 [Gossypium barbadense]
MPPKSVPLPAKPSKPNFFYGHRKPSQNRPVVYGGLFSNRQVLKPPQSPLPPSPPFDLRKWDPHHLSQNPSPPPISTPHQHSKLSPIARFIIDAFRKSQYTWGPSVVFELNKLRRVTASLVAEVLKNPSPPPISTPHQHSKLSPIARFIIDAFRKSQYTWGPSVVFELNKLRRVTASLVAEVLKVQDDPILASKFFHWAGKQKGFKHNFASYNALAYCLNRNGRFRVADQLPELMDSQGKPPTEKQFEILIRMHADKNRGQRVYYVYQKMKNFGIKPRVFLYNRIMDALVKTGYLDLALSVYEDFRGDGLVEESITFMILIKGLCKAGKVAEMLEVLRRMREMSYKPDVFAYTAMIKILVSKGNLDGCLRVWEEMQRDGVEPDVMAYVTLVAGLCKGGRVQRGYELFKEMKKKGILIERVMYGVLIEGFVKDGKVGSACGLLKDLIDSGYRADLGIYNSLLEGMCDVKLIDRAYKLFQVTVQEGLEPGFATVKPMLLVFAEMRRMSDFCKLLEQMQKLGFSVNDDLSKFFSFVVEKGERTIMAVRVFNELKVKGYGSVLIYNILMGALHKTGKVKQALSLFQEMKDLNFEPDSSTYSNAIICYVEDENIKEACICHNKIIEMSRVPSIDAYYSLTNGLCKIGEIDAAMVLVRDCLGNVTNGPMEFKYALTVLPACKSGAEKVMEVLNEMMQEGLPPDNIICSAIISGMCKYRTIEEARKNCGTIVFPDFEQVFVFGSFTEDETRSLLSKQSSGNSEKPVATKELQFGSFNVAAGGSLGSANGNLSNKPSSTNGSIEFLSSTSRIEDGKSRKTTTDHSLNTLQTPKEAGSANSSSSSCSLSNGVKQLNAKGIDVTSVHLSINELNPLSDSQSSKFHVLESEIIENRDQNGTVDTSLGGSVRGDIAKEEKDPIKVVKNLVPRGLINSGNLCFLNATLQALLSCSPFVQLLQQLKLRNIPKVGYPILTSFAEFVSDFDVPSSDSKLKKKDTAVLEIGRPFSPVMFESVLKSFTPDVPNSISGRPRQEDAQEFLSFIMDQMHDELVKLQGQSSSSNGVRSSLVSYAEDDEWETVGPKNKSAVTRTQSFLPSELSDIFGGQLRSVVKAIGNKASATVQPFLLLHLDIHPEAVHTIEDALHLFSAPEFLEGYRASTAGKCQAGVVTAKKSVKIQTLSKIMILHLMRFSYGSQGSTKLHKPVHFPLELVLGRELLVSSSTELFSQCCLANLLFLVHECIWSAMLYLCSTFLCPNLLGRKYELAATITHHGREPSKGHYTADARYPNGQWLRFDDASVTAIGTSKVLHDQAYVLFYEQT